MRIQDSPMKAHTSFFSLSLIVILLLVIAGYMIFTLRGTEIQLEQLDKELENPIFSGSMKMIEVPNSETKLNVPSWQLFTKNGIWQYVSFSAPLDKDFVPIGLQGYAGPRSEQDKPMQVRQELVAPLEKLFDAARGDGYNLMISSAYRSIPDQQRLYDEFVAKKGIEQAKKYVATPGTSEHHTGLAVDLTDSSAQCAKNSDACNLSPATAAWLADNAYKFGFIQRFAEGKKAVTGIAFEPWHYRYVGILMAKALYESELSYDEFVEQVAPGYKTNAIGKSRPVENTLESQ